MSQATHMPLQRATLRRGRELCPLCCSAGPRRRLRPRPAPQSVQAARSGRLRAPHYKEKQCEWRLKRSQHANAMKGRKDEKKLLRAGRTRTTQCHARACRTGWISEIMSDERQGRDRAEGPPGPPGPPEQK